MLLHLSSIASSMNASAGFKNEHACCHRVFVCTMHVRAAVAHMLTFPSDIVRYARLRALGPPRVSNRMSDLVAELGKWHSMSRSKSNESNEENAALTFLAGGGQVGKCMRQQDWNLSPLGDPAGWPQSLHTKTSQKHQTKTHKYFACGADLCFLYN